MEAAAVWSLSLFADAPWWRSGAAVGLLVAVLAAALLLVARLRVGPTLLLEEDSTMADDDTGFRSSRFAARVCSACSQPMLLEGDGRWRCAAYPACRS